MHKFTLGATYLWLQQKWGQSVLEMPEERLGIEVFGREQGE